MCGSSVLDSFSHDSTAKIFNRFALRAKRPEFELCFADSAAGEIGVQLQDQGFTPYFFKNDVDEILNLQPIGHLAKAYQVKQVREVLLKYQLAKGVISDE
jgi:hypothetical protein